MTSTTVGLTTPVGDAVTAPAVPVPRIDTGRVADLVTQLLVELGEDPSRDGLADTPRRVAAWWNEFLAPDGAVSATCFAEPLQSGQLVVVGGMNVWSLCEHHLLPMRLTVTAGYVPRGEVLGLSKFGRIATHVAGRLQVQERFTRQVAERLSGAAGSEDIAVSVRGVHLCMSMRGVRMADAVTTTVHSEGRFLTDPVLAQQFLTLAAPRGAA
ncbi:GTP cyclohydrolase I [Streptomyces sp. 4F14]|uniref:GTP cyclohydrolase I n=1 Tax=Streptomyces sp. 4F14 TaxID=3394380 RepID=UPI003A85098F